MVTGDRAQSGEQRRAARESAPNYEGALNYSGAMVDSVAPDNGLERYGVDTIPESARTSSPRDVVTILSGFAIRTGVAAVAAG